MTWIVPEVTCRIVRIHRCHNHVNQLFQLFIRNVSLVNFIPVKITSQSFADTFFSKP